MITKKYKKKNQFVEVLQRMRRNKAAMIGLIIVIFMILKE